MIDVPVQVIDVCVFFQAAREVSLAKWGEWEDAMGLPDGWKVKTETRYYSHASRSTQ